MIACHAIVVYTFGRIGWITASAIFGGHLSLTGGFIAGAAFTASCIFCEYYWSEISDV